jgi:small-conductance mechanosensitive channel
MSTVISFRVKKEIKEELEKAGIDIAKEIKKVTRVSLESENKKTS